MDQHFGAPFEVAATLHPFDFSLDISSGRNRNPLIDYEWKGGFRVDRVSILRRLGGDCLLERERHAGAGWDDQRGLGGIR